MPNKNLFNIEKANTSQFNIFNANRIMTTFQNKAQCFLKI